MDDGRFRWPSVPWLACARRSNHCVECSGKGGCRAAPCTRRGNGNGNGRSKSWFPVGWRGGSGCGGRCKYVPVSSVAASMRLTPPQPDPPRLRQFSAICWNDVLPRWVSTLVDTVDPRHAWMTHSISDRCVDQGRHLPTAARNKAAVANSRVNLSKVGRCGWAGPLAPWMAPSSPQGRVYGVSCPPTPPRHPTECTLLLLLLLRLLHSLRRVQGAALPNPLKCLWEPARTARRSAC